MNSQVLIGFLKAIKTELENGDINRTIHHINQVVNNYETCSVNRVAKFKIGHTYTNRLKQLCEIIDIHRTYNEKGEMMFLRYVVVHEFCGQRVVDRDVCETTILRESKS